MLQFLPVGMSWSAKMWRSERSGTVFSFSLLLVGLWKEVAGNGSWSVCMSCLDSALYLASVMVKIG